MDLLKEYAMDATLTRHGVWVSLSTWRNIDEKKAKTEPSILIAYLGNSLYQAAIAQEIKALMLAGTKYEEMTTEQQEEINAKVMAQTIVLSWQNVEMGGEPFPYTQENAMMLLTDSRFEVLSNKIIGKAQNIRTFRVNYEEAMLKNLDRSLPGTSLTEKQPSGKKSEPRTSTKKSRST